MEELVRVYVRHGETEAAFAVAAQDAEVEDEGARGERDDGADVARFIESTVLPARAEPQPEHEHAQGEGETRNRERHARTVTTGARGGLCFRARARSIGALEMHSLG